MISRPPFSLRCLALSLVLASLSGLLWGQGEAPPADPGPTADVGTVSDDSAPPPSLPPEAAPSDPAEATDLPASGADAVPTAYPEDRYIVTWDKNPFLLKTAVVAQKTESFAKDWALSGISATKGIYTVRIFNKQTNKFARLREGEVGSEFRLVSVHYNKDRTQSMVKVARGSEVAELKFDDSLLSRPVTVSNTQGNAGAPAGQAPGQPGTPPMPGAAPAMPGATAVPGAPPGAGNPRILPGMNRPGQPLPPGAVPGTPAMGAPVNPASPGIATPPPVSRRRQLIPAPIQQAQ